MLTQGAHGPRAGPLSRGGGFRVDNGPGPCYNHGAKSFPGAGSGRPARASLTAVSRAAGDGIRLKRLEIPYGPAPYRPKKEDDHVIQVRQETERDYFETESMFREAFWNHYTPACSEHYLVHRMRSCPAFVPELALVAVDGGRIVGGAMCLRAYILGDNGTRYAVLSLGPLGVLPAYQNRGIGGLLIARTKKIAAGMDGICGILLCGDPDYYVRQGFVPAERFGIRNGENLFADALQVYELHAGALSQAKGLYLEDAIYAVDEALVMEYDQQFPAKEALSGVGMQERFAEMARRVRPYQAEPPV